MSGTGGSALAGTVVVSVGHTLPGLYCVAALRDLGAQVIRVERPMGPHAGTYDAFAGAFPTRSLVAGTAELKLDLKRAAGADAFRRIAGAADVVLEGFRPGVAARLGLDAEALRAAHPELVHVAISGYGQQGPHRDRVGHDVNYLAETGVLALANPIGLPGVAFADGLAGMSAALNVVAALHARTRIGAGQAIDCAIVDGPLFLMASELEHYWATGESRGAGGTHLTGRHPWYGVHACADGGAVAVGAVEPGFYASWCRAIGHPELAGEQMAEGDALEAASETARAAFAARTRDEAVALCGEADACVSPVLATGEVAGSRLAERVIGAGPGEGERIVRSPVRLPPAELAPDGSGRAILAGLGFSEAELDALEDSGAWARSE